MDSCFMLHSFFLLLVIAVDVGVGRLSKAKWLGM